MNEGWPIEILPAWQSIHHDAMSPNWVGLPPGTTQEIAVLNAVNVQPGQVVRVTPHLADRMVRFSVGRPAGLAEPMALPPVETARALASANSQLEAQGTDITGSWEPLEVEPGLWAAAAERSGTPCRAFCLTDGIAYACMFATDRALEDRPDAVEFYVVPELRHKLLHRVTPGEDQARC